MHTRCPCLAGAAAPFVFAAIVLSAVSAPAARAQATTTTVTVEAGSLAIAAPAGTITKVGTATYTAKDPGSLTEVVPVITATEITGINSATWTPTIHVDVPAA
jgi:hypothetical protein